MLKASVWLVSNVACEQSIHTEVRGSRGALHAGACVEEHGAAAAAAARRCTAEVEDKWTRAEQALAWPLTLTLTPTPTPTPTPTSTSTPTLTPTLTLTLTLTLTPEP